MGYNPKMGIRVSPMLWSREIGGQAPLMVAKGPVFPAQGGFRACPNHGQVCRQMPQV